jgi:hypothetical protein
MITFGDRGHSGSIDFRCAGELPLPPDSKPRHSHRAVAVPRVPRLALNPASSLTGEAVSVTPPPARARSQAPATGNGVQAVPPPALWAANQLPPLLSRLLQAIAQCMALEEVPAAIVRILDSVGTDGPSGPLSTRIQTNAPLKPTITPFSIHDALDAVMHLVPLGHQESVSRILQFIIGATGSMKTV